MKRRSFVAMSLAAVTLPASASARAQETPESTTDFGSLLPAASAFGKGWKKFGNDVPSEVDNTTFVDGVLTAYGGPHGQRVRILILEHPDDRAAVNAAWETATFTLAYLFVSSDYDVDYFDDSLNSAPIPTGTADAMRYQGTFRPYEFTFDSGAYAVEPNFVVIIGVEGDEVEYPGAEFTIADNIASGIAAKLLSA
ncbi:MAG: hypothetical protein ACRDHN_07630 [Thermomicrobiales bacterium]